MERNRARKKEAFKDFGASICTFSGKGRMFTIYVRIDLRIPPSLVFRNNCTVRERERENESGFSNFVERAATDAATLSQKRGGGGGMVLRRRRRREEGHTCP